MSNTTKHTPGPWKVFRPKTSNATFGIDSISGEAVVWFGEEPHNGICRVEDARLISAAPELLDELQSALVQMSMAADCVENGYYHEALLHLRSMIKTKRAAIAKATGETP